MVFVVLAVVSMMVFAVIAAATIGVFGSILLMVALVVLFSLMVGGALFGGSSSPLIVAALVIGAGLLLGKRRRQQREHIGQPPVDPVVGPRRRVADKAPPTTDPALADAWDALSGHADWARSRVAVARASCDRFLQLADRAPLHGEAAELAILIRKRIPEHVDEALGKLDLVTAAEARALLDDTVLTVEKVGARAERLRDTLMSAETATLAVQRTHLSRRIDNEPFTLN